VFVCVCVSACRSAMDDLTPNPKRCSEFQPHPFKKKQCKNCGRPWREHKGVISEKHLHGFLKAKADAENKRLREEAEANAKARAKALAKKKASRSAEDEWFFDDAKDEAESEEEQVGFQMLEGGDFKSTTATTPEAPVEKQTGKTMKVVNLIDFGQCDVKEEASTESGGEPIGPGLPGTVDHYEQSDIASSAGPESATAPAGPGPVELMQEIELLRQRLKDSDAERDVLVSIVQDKVAEKQRVIDDLMRQRTETEKNLRSTQESVEALTRQKEEAVRVAATAEAAASAAAAQAAEAVAARDAAAAEMAAAKSQQEECARSPGPLRQSADHDEPKQEVPIASNPAQLQVERADTAGLAGRLLNPRVWTKCLRPPE